jgi:hypothetical protein
MDHPDAIGETLIDETLAQRWPGIDDEMSDATLGEILENKGRRRLALATAMPKTSTPLLRAAALSESASLARQ